MNTLSEKELIVIDRIGNSDGKLTQRKIAENTGLSLGLTNLILKRLTKTGYIKISQLTPRKMHYIMTRKGITEKARKSYRYIEKTIRELTTIKDCVQRLLISEYQLGSRKIGVIGDNELTEIIKSSPQNIEGIEIVWFGNDFSIDDVKGVDLVIDCQYNPKTMNGFSSLRMVHLVDHIASKI